MSDSLRSHGLQHTRPPCPTPTLGTCSNSCQSNRWCQPTISSSVVPVSSCFQSCPDQGLPISQFFTSDGQSIGISASASVFPINIQDWFPLPLTGLISLQSKGFSRVFSNTTVQNINWMCLFYENSLSFKLVHLFCMLEFNSFSFYIPKSKSWVQSMCFSEGIWFSLFSGLGKIVSIFQMKLT